MTRTVLYTRCPVPTASGIAIDTSLAADLAAVGTEVSALQRTSYPEAHFDHRAPSLFREGGNIPALWARSNGAATRLLALTWVPEFQAIVAPKGAGLTVHDLVGGRLVLPTHGGPRVDFFRAMALRGFNSALCLTGRSLADATLVDVAATLPQVTDVGADGFYAGTLAALRNGVGQFGYVKGAPGADVVLRGGVDVVVDLTQANETAVLVNNGTPRTLTVSQDLIADARDIAVEYVAALIRAGRWAAAHPAETAAIVAAETGSSPQGVRKGYGDTLHRSLEPTLDSTLLTHLDNQKRFLLAHNVIDNDFDIDQWLEPSILRDALELTRARNNQRNNP